MPVVVVLSTFPSEDKASEIARTLVTEGLAACVNIQRGGVRSIYRWQGKLEDELEALAIMKTTDDRLDALIARVKTLHPYEVPEVIALPVVAGYAPYLQWVTDSR